MKKLQILIFMLLLGFSVIAQQDTIKLTEEMFTEVLTENQINKNHILQPDKNIISELTPLSSYEFYLSLIVLTFGFLSLLLEVWIIRKRHISQDNAVKFILVTLIIIATLFLITAGYDNNQIAPAMGLLGTIAGYLIGKTQVNDNGKKDNKD